MPVWEGSSLDFFPLTPPGRTVPGETFQIALKLV
jgi:hypothetical protein